MKNRDNPLYQDLESILLPEATIRARVLALGAEITRDFQGRAPLCVGILKGAVPFFADLIRAIDLPLTIDFMALSSYGIETKSSGVVRVLKDLDFPIVGRDVIIVEDIVDSGLTLSYLKKMLEAAEPASFTIATLLDKPARRKTDLFPDYLGFTIEDQFVVGYGLDYQNRYRNLQDIGILKPELYTAK